MEDPQQQLSSTPKSKVNVEKLGNYIDGWSELLEGYSSKETEMRDEIYKHLQTRNMPEVALSSVTGEIGIVKKEGRDYVIAETYPSVKTVIIVRKHGNDLLVGWKSFRKPMWNLRLLKWVGIISAGIGFFIGGITHTTSMWGESSLSFSLLGWIGVTIALILLAALGLLFAGKRVFDDEMALFYYYPSLFDSEEITALNLSVHASVIRCIDKAGIDVSKLRIKQKFNAGRKGEDL